MMQKKVVLPVTGEVQPEKQLPMAIDSATILGLPVHVVWIVDVSPFVHWTGHGPVVESRKCGEEVARKREFAAQHAAELATKLELAGIPSSFEVRTGCLEQELRALEDSGNVIVNGSNHESAADPGDNRDQRQRLEGARSDVRCGGPDVTTIPRVAGYTPESALLDEISA